ncbi:MAG: hypothetical protein JXA23_06320 [Bacteroidales bacterium]|nr:hypothetical protein [Bacteroidales bacterium]
MKNILFTLALFLVISGTAISQIQYKTTPFQEVKEIPEGKALIYFYGAPHLGKFYHYRINLNDSTAIYPIHICEKGYFPYFADPGEVVFWSQVADAKTELPMTLVAGETYIVKCSAKSGMWIGKPYLYIEKPEKAWKELRKCKLLGKGV